MRTEKNARTDPIEGDIVGGEQVCSTAEEAVTFYLFGGWDKRTVSVEEWRQRHEVSFVTRVIPAGLVRPAPIGERSEADARSNPIAGDKVADLRVVDAVGGLVAFRRHGSWETHTVTTADWAAAQQGSTVQEVAQRDGSAHVVSART